MSTSAQPPVDQRDSCEEMIVASVENETNVKISYKSKNPLVGMFSEEYDILLSFINTIPVEQTKFEMKKFILPLFLYMYVELTKSSKKGDAREYWDAWIGDDNISCHKDAIVNFAVLTNYQQLSDKVFLQMNPYIKTMVATKFKIYISKFTNEMLQNFIIQKHLKEIVTILSAYTEIILSVNSYLLTDISNSKTTSAQIVDPSVLKISDDNKLFRELLKNMVLPKVILQSLKTKGAVKPTGSSGSSDINKPVDSSITNTSLSSSSSKKLSVLFTTVGNTYGEMTCMDIFSDFSCVAAGFSDSYVGIWPMDSEGFVSSIADATAKEVLPKARSSLSESGSSSGNATRQQQHHKGSPLYQLRGHRKTILSIASNVIHDSRLIVSSSADESIRLWDANKFHCVGKYYCYTLAWSVAFQNLGYYFASGNLDGSVCLYSTDRVSPIRIMTGHTSDVTKTTWHSNPMLVISGSDDKSCKLWDIRSAKCIRSFTASKESYITSIASSSCGTMIAAGLDNGKAHVWDISTGRALSIVDAESSEKVEAIAFTEEGRSISLGVGTSIHTWKIKGDKASCCDDYSIFGTKNSAVYAMKVPDSGPHSNYLFAGGPCL